MIGVEVSVALTSLLKERVETLGSCPMYCWKCWCYLLGGPCGEFWIGIVHVVFGKFYLNKTGQDRSENGDAFPQMLLLGYSVRTAI